MKWGYIITILEPGKKKPLCLSYKNAKTAWKAYQHFKRKYRDSEMRIILTKNTRIIEMKLPNSTFSQLSQIQKLGGASK